MRFLEIYVNDQKTAIADLPRFDLVTIGIIHVPGATHPILQATGMRKSTDEHPQLLGMELRRKDIVRIAFIDNQTESQNIGTKRGATDSEEVYSSEPINTYVLEVALSGKKSITASVSGESTVQFTVTWVKLNEKCKIELGCIGNKSQLGAEMWFEWGFGLGETVEVGIR